MEAVKSERVEKAVAASGGMDIVSHARKSFAELPQEEQEAIQMEFEILYGSDFQTRTRDQWKRLVAKYGIPTIMKQEGLTKAYIKAKLKPGKL